MDILFGKKNEVLLYGAGAIILIILVIYLFKQAKEGILDIKDVITGGDHQAEENAQKSRQKIIDGLVINKSRLKYTPNSYKASADKLHAGLTTIGRMSSLSYKWIKPIIQTYSIKKDDWNMLRKEFGVRDGRDMFQYILDKTTNYPAPFSDQTSPQMLNDLIAAANKKHGIKNAKDNVQLIG